MNLRLRLVTRIYACLVWTYPRDFRKEFEGEMSTVFHDAASEAGRRGGYALARLCLRELRDWPVSLVREHWARIRCRAGRYAMPEVRVRGSWSMDSDREALVAALPPLLLGLGIALSSLVIRDPWYAVPSWRMGAGIALGVIPVAVLAVGGLIALAKRLPDWGYTWSGFALMGFVLLVKTLADERADEGAALVSPVGDIVVGLVLLLGIIALLGVTAMRGWRQAGLVSIAFSAIAGLSLYS
ncbi:MAG: hypothetical protein ABIH46_12665, partial [Chloroflexota bacterium]